MGQKWQNIFSYTSFSFSEDMKLFIYSVCNFLYAYELPLHSLCLFPTEIFSHIFLIFYMDINHLDLLCVVKISFCIHSKNFVFRFQLCLKVKKLIIPALKLHILELYMTIIS